MTEEEKIRKTTRRGGPFLLLGPPIAMLFFTRGLTSTVLTDLIVYRTCLTSLDINATECFMLKTDAGSPEALAIEPQVEPEASMVVMAKTLIESILPALVSLFLGPWSDRAGRKPLFVSAFSGFILEFAILSLLCNWNISPWYLLFALVPANILGGTSTAKLASVCYVSDTTVKENRMVQLALLDVSICCGNMLGGFAGPFIFANWGYLGIFGTAAACCISALVYIYVRIPKKVKDAAEESVPGVFEPSFIRELIKKSFMKREGFHRSVIWLSILVITLIAAIQKGEISTIEFLFTRTRLGWNVRDYSYLNATDFVLRIVGLCIVLLRSRIPGVPDTVIAGISLLSFLGSALTKSWTWQSWHMYVASCIGLLSGVVAPVIRTVMTKIVPAQELGKVFTLASMIEIVGSFVGAPLFTLIYTSYLPPIYPSPVHLLSVGLLIISILAVACIEILIRKSRRKDNAIDAAEEDRFLS